MFLPHGLCTYPSNVVLPFPFFAQLIHIHLLELSLEISSSRNILPQLCFPGYELDISFIPLAPIIVILLFNICRVSNLSLVCCSFPNTLLDTVDIQ